jgi:hypothetical protein
VYYRSQQKNGVLEKKLRHGQDSWGRSSRVTEISSKRKGGSMQIGDRPGLHYATVSRIVREEQQKMLQ